ncbi:mis18-binding protein 1 [Pungitius pungitius]|uniref:mis18-binding protein 1 n=1 Tax=Pungitius pungitius TaxID=134920 RepID=UPI002E13134B
MASYHHLFREKTPRFESPAKVFAKLKSKVQREETCAEKETFRGNDPRCRDKHVSVFTSPMKRAESTRITDEFKESRRCDSYRNEAQALTLSPISSPQKTFRHSEMVRKEVEEMRPVIGTCHGCTPRKRAFLESTAVSHLSSVVSRKPINTQSPQTRDPGGFTVTCRTPVKVQPEESDFESSVFLEGCAPLDKLKSPAFVFSPVRKRLKRNWELQELNKVVSNEPRSQPQERKTSSASNGDNNTCTESLGRVRGSSADPSEGNQFTHKPVFLSPRSIATNRCYVPLERFIPMSPAKMFAYMKERESKTKQEKVQSRVSSSTRDLLDPGEFHQAGDTLSPSPVHTVGEMEDTDFRSAPESVAPVDRSRAESAGGASDTDPSEDGLSRSVSPQPLLLEDSLVLKTPQISVPKTQEPVFKRNKWPQSAKFPNESVIYLEKWFLRKNHKGLFVDGIHREEKIPWNSNIIVDRVSNNVVKTVSGRVYILVNRMKMSSDSGLPKWLLKKFANGFPPDWDALYKRFLSGSSDNHSRKPERNSRGKGVASKAKSEASSIVTAVKQHRKNSPKTSDLLPAPSSRLSVSRSGRVIRPPLDYWKGGRVILDAHMNVTIHECYDTSIHIPFSKTTSTRTSQKPARELLPRSEGRQQCESDSDREEAVLRRSVKAPLRKHNSAKMRPEIPVETPPSPKDWSGRQTRSNRRRPAPDKTTHVDSVPQKQREPEKSLTKRSQKQTHDTTRPAARVSSRKRTVPKPQESCVDYGSSASSEDGVSRRKSSGKEVHGKAGNKSRPSYMFPSSESSNSSEFERELEKTTKVTQTKHKPRKCTTSSSPTKSFPTATRSSKPKANKANAAAPRDQDADGWTEAELVKLQEAVSCFPKCMAGYWAKVARMVGTRSAEECHFQHTCQGASQTPPKRAKKPPKDKLEAPKDTDRPAISARVGTLKRKQQVRQFLEAMPREDVEDVFSSAYMQNKRFEMPSMCQSDQDFPLSEMVPHTPMSTGFPEVKTPRCLQISPGMMGSPNRTNDDKLVYQLQKRMKKNRFNACKPAASSKAFTLTPSVKRTMRRCGNTENDTFFVWEMFPGNDGVLPESEEEEDEDFYYLDKA